MKPEVFENQPLQDLCISAKSRLAWGIELPLIGIL